MPEKDGGGYMVSVRFIEGICPGISIFQLHENLLLLQPCLIFLSGLQKLLAGL